MSELKVTGVIEKLLDVESGTSKATGNDWQKQCFVVANNGGYEGKKQIFCFEVFGSEKVENLSKYNKAGDEVTVSFNIGTNEWNGKYFTSLQSWKIEKLIKSEQPKTQVAQAEEDDLPF